MLLAPGMSWRNETLTMPIPVGEEYFAERERLSNWFPNIGAVEAAALRYASSLASLKVHLGVFDVTVLYEDLVSRPAETAKRLFQVMGIGEGHVPEALKALEKDSQAGIVASDLGEVPMVELRAAIDASLRRMRIPLTSSCTVDDFRSFVDLNAQ